jgi:hypothetical protein
MAPVHPCEQGTLVSMGEITRVDRVIGITLLAVLVALVGLGLSQRSAPALPSAGIASSRSGSGSPPGPGATPTAAPAGTIPFGGPGLSPAPGLGQPAAPMTRPAPSTTTVPPALAGPVSAVGDSIMIDIQPYLESAIAGVTVDGEVSRQFETGVGIVQADRAAGTLGAVLVVELGTNGSVTAADFDALMQAAAGVKRVVFVNINVPRPWEVPDNAVLSAGVARYPGLAVLADWNAESTPHPEWFTPDQVHLEPAGAQALAALVARCS